MAAWERRRNEPECVKTVSLLSGACRATKKVEVLLDGEAVPRLGASTAVAGAIETLLSTEDEISRLANPARKPEDPAPRQQRKPSHSCFVIYTFSWESGPHFRLYGHSPVACAGKRLKLRFCPFFVSQSLMRRRYSNAIMRRLG